MSDDPDPERSDSYSNAGQDHELKFRPGSMSWA